MAAGETTYDVAVVGGGLVGAALAYGMARQRARVCLLDGKDIAFRASRANLALVKVQGKGGNAPAYAELSRRSASLWADFARQLVDDSGVDIHFEQAGGFEIALSDAELEKRSAFLAAIQSQPGVGDLRCEILDRSALQKLLPIIGDEVVGGSFTPLDGHCNSLLLLRALYTAIARQGGCVLTGLDVSSLEMSAGLFQIDAEQRRIGAKKIVLAAGLGNKTLAQQIGINAPLSPQKGQILVTEKCEPFLPYPLNNMRQASEGGIMIGGSKEDAGFDTSSRVDVMARIADRAIRTFPRLRTLNIVRSWAGLRVMTPDGLPLYEESELFPGAFVTNCHSGVTLAAFHAQELAPALLTTGLPPSLSPFAGKRFDVHAEIH